MSVCIVGASGLRGSDWLPSTGKPDCYCELKSGDATYTTPIISNTCEPVWSENFEIAMPSDGTPLEFSVYVKDTVSSDFLGRAVLESKDYAEGFNGSLALADAGADQAAILKVQVQVPGQGLPPGAPSEFTTSIEKFEQSASFGLDLDTLSNDMLFVLDIQPGPVMDYNATAKPEYQFKIGDAIVGVNGKAGSIRALLSEFRNEMKVECRVHRTVAVTVIFNRGEASEPLGLEFPEKVLGDILVVKGIAGGAAAKHNDFAEEHEKLHAGDRIVSVGKMTAVQATELQDQLQSSSGPVRLRIARVAAPPAEGGRLAHWLYG